MRFLSLDTRALGLMRICVASVIIIDLSIRLGDLEAFYSDSGVTPLSVVFSEVWNQYFFSFHVISGMWQVQLALFLISFWCALMLLIGYRTGLFTVLSWIMMVSLHNRNVFILQGGDDLLRMVLFWCMFIPWGARYSCDSLFAHEPPPASVRTPATLAYVLQIGWIYTGSALLKGPEWSRDFTAVYYAYSLDQIAYPWTAYMYHHPILLRVLTIVAYYFELLVPLLFFVPVKHAWFRAAGVAFIMLFHLWNGTTLLIGIFYLVGIATCVGILPAFVMDAFDITAARLKRHVVASFTGIAALAGKLVKWKPSGKPAVAVQYASSGAVVFLMLFVADWNLSNLDFIHSKVPRWLHPLAYTLRIDQCWGMFSPGVLKDDGWYVMEGTCADGRCIDLLAPGQKITYAKPASVVGMYKNDRWRKYAENYMFAGNDFMRAWFCEYFRKRWNEKSGNPAVSALKVIYMSEFTKPDYRFSAPEKAVLCDCGE